VVLGGGVTGMLAARVLADTFEQVTIIERHTYDLAGSLDSGPQSNRRSIWPVVPQALSERARPELERLFPCCSASGFPADALNWSTTSPRTRRWMSAYASGSHHRRSASRMSRATSCGRIPAWSSSMIVRSRNQSHSSDTSSASQSGKTARSIGSVVTAAWADTCSAARWRALGASSTSRRSSAATRSGRSPSVVGRSLPSLSDGRHRSAATPPKGGHVSTPSPALAVRQEFAPRRAERGRLWQ
jgi:hypothetical protein